MSFKYATPAAANFLHHIQYEYLPWVGISDPSPAHIGTIYNAYWAYGDWEDQTITYSNVGHIYPAGKRVDALMKTYFPGE
jgi:hypothetical protein